MGDLQNPRKCPSNLHPHLLFLLLFVFSLLLGRSSALFTPLDNHLITCGSTSTSTLDDHRVFLPDDGSSHSAVLLSSGPKISLADPNPPPALSPLYRTARVFTKPSSYSFQIKSKGTHMVRLHFYPFSAHEYNLSHALFHVTASELVLLSNFGFQSSSQFAPLLKEYFLRVESEKLVITFTPADGSSFSFVNAIEVVSCPRDLIPDNARLVLPDRIEESNGLSKQSLQTLFRINVGGRKVTPFNDTLWRTWIPDPGFLKLISSTSRTVSYSSRIKYQKYGASREIAPDSVYSTARVMSASMPNSNITWVFPVSCSYRYLIRMHFCDIASLALNELYFNVYINVHSAYEDFDLSASTGQALASPYYVDFIADPDGLGVLSVSIGPSRLSSPSKISGLLNGLEILKINNSVGSLDGELPVTSIRASSRRGIFGTFVRSLMCGFAFMSLLVIVYMLVLKLRAEWKNSVGWSPLPVDVSDGETRYGNTVASGKSVLLKA